MEILNKIKDRQRRQRSGKLRRNMGCNLPNEQSEKQHLIRFSNSVVEEENKPAIFHSVIKEWGWRSVIAEGNFKARYYPLIAVSSYQYRRRTFMTVSTQLLLASGHNMRILPSVSEYGRIFYFRNKKLFIIRSSTNTDHGRALTVRIFWNHYCQQT